MDGSLFLNGFVYLVAAGKPASFTDETVRGSQPYPDFQCAKPDGTLRDPNFIVESNQDP